MFSGKTAIVTGASRGLGNSISKELGHLGANVVLVATNKDRLKKSVDEICSCGGKAHGIVCDVSNAENVKLMSEEVFRMYGSVDILVNAAGIPGKTDWIINYEPHEWDRVMAVNLKGPFLCSKALLPDMIARKSGKIVNIAAGVMDERVDYGCAAYYASKAGLINFTRQLAAEVKRYGINVNAIDPGGILTDFSEDILRFEEETDAFAGTQTNKNPALRLRPTQHIVPMVIFLLSDESKAMTGRFLQASSQDDVQYLQL